jgi:hypothetical protein
MRAWGILAAACGVLEAWSTGCNPSVNPYSAPTLTGNGTPTRTPVPFTPTPRTPTASPTVTLSPTPTPTPTLTSSTTPTFTWTASPTGTRTFTQTGTPTGTASFTSTATPTSTVTFTPTITGTPTPSATSTWTGTSTFSPTLTPTDTSTATGTPTETDTITSTPTPSFTPTNTPTSTPTCAGSSGSFAPAAQTYGPWGDVNLIDARPITVTGLVYITDFQLQGSNAASTPFTENIGIYSDSGGAPGTLIASGSGSVAAGGMNPDIPFGSAVPLTTGVYWLAADSDNNTGGEVTNPGFGVQLAAASDGTYAGSDPTGDPIAMPGSFSSLGAAQTGTNEPCITANWSCP